MSELEPRYPCPVCVGVSMRKLRFASQEPLILDYCQRCGGIWFDLGEVPLLRSCRPQALWRQIELSDEAYHMTCHSCFAKMPRNAPTCLACQWANIIDCPVCSRPLQPIDKNGLKLDVCRECKGVWFDNIELAELWNLQLTSNVASDRVSRSRDGVVIGDEALMLLDVLTYAPGVAHLGVEAVIEGQQHITEVSIQVLSNAPEVAGSLVDSAGDAAAGVFETIVEIISGLFS